MKSYRFSLLAALVAVLSSAGSLRADGNPPVEDGFYPITDLPAPDGSVVEPGGIDLLPGGKIVVGTRRGDVWMIDGVMEIGHGDEQWQLAAGDCLAMRLDAPIRFHNPGAKPARYLVALTGAEAWR